MRVLITTFPATTHLYSQVNIAWALQGAGHEVLVAGHPGMEREVTAAGLSMVAVGEEFEADDGGGAQLDAGMDLDLIAPQTLAQEPFDRLHGLFTMMTPFVFHSVSEDKMVDDLVDVALRWRPDLVLWEPHTFAGAIAARVCGAASARVMLFGLDVIATMRTVHRDRLAGRPPELRDDPLADWLAGHLARYGVDYDEGVALGDFTVNPCPLWMRAPTDPPEMHYVPVRYLAYNGQRPLPHWLREPPARPRVCLTLGVGFRDVLKEDEAPVERLLLAMERLDVEVVATLNETQTSALERIPDNVRVVDFVPLNALLPTCSAIIHHGGAGTFGSALAAGIPQMIFPCDLADTEHMGRKLAEQGAGVHVARDHNPDVEWLRDRIADMLDNPAFARNARRLRDETARMPSPSDIVPVLERLAERYRRVPVGR
ncbi:activator-dependent family glycosyltransferase [Thermobifida alba]|jgi:glycosyltransferase (activator-dependent family)|uniref:Activator-dependent family glycosyltransferase n=1 Tax=Thermobifida alba TaxID=53522 RepID=A0ABY4L3E7_THEAE|nr:activator-dependent family glycosyltransferase [Thermobifida alba]UPT20810.1 activator-dependent family glycosyltransferase [Thermobifida alba]